MPFFELSLKIELVIDINFYELPMINAKLALSSLVLSLSFTISSPSYAIPPLEFTSAYQDVLANTYELKAADANVTAKEADRWQAGAYPNPALIVNLNTIGRQQGDDENQLYVGVTQVVELGGKRSARLRVAGASQCTTQWNVEILKNELFVQLLKAFIDMAAAQERVALAQGQQKIAEQTLATISTKTSSGKGSGIEEKKAQVAFKSARLIFIRQQAYLQKMKKQLSSLWDSNPPTFDCVDFPLYRILPPPPLETLTAALKCSPEIIQAEAEAVLACEIVSLERSKRIPDIAFQVGVSTEKFTQQPALNVGFGIPLPLFDQNQGNISRASYEQLQAIYKQLDLIAERQAALEMLYVEWISAYEQATILKESLLPAAQEAFTLAQGSYNEGKSDYLNLLDARSTLFDVQQQYLDALEEYHHKRAEVFKLTASYPLNEI